MMVVNVDKNLMVLIGNVVITIPVQDQQFFFEKLMDFLSINRQMSANNDNYYMDCVFKTPALTFNSNSGKFYRVAGTQTRSDDVDVSLLCNSTSLASTWSCKFVVMEELAQAMSRLQMKDVKQMKKKVLQVMVLGGAGVESLMQNLLKGLPKIIMDMFDSISYGPSEMVASGQKRALPAICGTMKATTNKMAAKMPVEKIPVVEKGSFQICHTYFHSFQSRISIKKYCIHFRER